MKRRTLVAGAGSIALAGLAGCLGVVGLDEHEATPAGVDPATREETGYEQTGIEELVVEREVGGVEEIVVRNYVTEHEKSVDLGALGEQRAAVFMVLTTPKIEIPGQQFNPVEDMSAEELVDMVATNYEGIDDVEHDADETIEVLGQDTVGSRFTADAQFDGSSVDVYMHVSEAVETENDLLVTIGVYPQELRDQEESNVYTLMEHVTEDADATGDDGGSDDGDGDDGADGDGDGDGDGDDDGGIDV